jgi:Zn-dependent M28 family amino/carboxypeptidase
MQHFAPVSGSSAPPTRRDRLALNIHCLATEIGPRNIYHCPSLSRAAQYIESALCEAGYVPTRQTFEAKGKSFSNIIAEKPGTDATGDIFVVGAHYDTHKDSPGANDNGSGIAAMLELARAVSGERPRKSIRFVAFTNEESPFTRTRHMGSYVYAQACRARSDKIIGMLCLETLGCYSEEPGSQWLSLGGLLLPGRGDFLALVGNLGSKPLLHLCSKTLRAESPIRVRSLSFPGELPGVRSSDHWSFWKSSYQAIMATDTAPLRYKHYHRATDTPDKIDFEWLERVVDGLIRVVRSASHSAM